MRRKKSNPQTAIVISLWFYGLKSLALYWFSYLSKSLCSSTLPRYWARYLLSKSKNCTFGGASVKERQIMKFKGFFSSGIKEIFLMVYRR